MKKNGKRYESGCSSSVLSVMEDPTEKGNFYLTHILLVPHQESEIDSNERVKSGAIDESELDGGINFVEERWRRVF